MRRLLTLIVLSTLAAPLAARADGSIQLNARGGFGLPLGSTAGSAKYKDAIAYAIPLQADLQFRMLKQLSLGGYFRYSLNGVATDAKDLCEAAGATCSSTGMGFGLISEYRFSEKLEGGGWLGAQLGYELLESETKAGGTTESATAKGFELGVSAGWDATLGGLTVGPWVFLNVGQFSTVDASGGGSGSIPDKKIHALAGVGLRVSLLL